ncbi:MAG: DUF2079 domain-containing protein [Anaerolineae bacterium]
MSRTQNLPEGDATGGATLSPGFRAGTYRSWLAARWPCLILAGLIAAYFAYFGALTVGKHNAFRTTAFDLGNVDQAVWNTRHGRPLAMTNIEGLNNRLGTHVEPILLPISLLYFVWSDPRALLLLQTLVIALGAWPVYLLARWAYGRREGGAGEPAWPVELLGLAFALAYLLFPALQSANVFDFHAVALAPTFFLFALYFLERERWGAYGLFCLLTMSCKEDMPLLVAMLGIYALVVRRRWLVGAVTLVTSLAWFLLAVGWIMPHFDTRAVSPFANRYAYLGDGPLEMAVTLLTRPGLVLEQAFTGQNLRYLLNLLAPLAFLSLLAPQVLVLALPSLAVNLLSTDGFMHQLEGFHYGAPLAPVVVASAAYGAAWLARRERLSRLRSLPLLLAGAVLIASLAYHAGHGYTPLAADGGASWPRVTAHHHLGADMATAIPAPASLAALPRPNPHASQRQHLYMIDRLQDGRPAPLSGVGGAVPAEYIWLDVTDGWPLHPNDLKRGVEALLEEDFGIEGAENGWLLLRRGAPATALPDRFYDFARAPEPRPGYAAQIRFYLDGQPALECLGYDLRREAQSGAYYATFYWRALQPLPPGLRLYPFFFDDAGGQVVEDTTLRPMIATLWYPPERWQPGEVVVTEMLPWYAGPTFSLGLGVVQGDDWGAVEWRLPIGVESSDLVIRLFEGDTWARLLQLRDGEAVEERRSFGPVSPSHPLDADFGGQVRLLGYDLARERREGQEILAVTFYWQAQQRLETGYSVFAQLLDPAGGVFTQVDAVPQGGGYPTFWWLPGEVVVDTLDLALPGQGLAEDGYRLITGLYDPATGDRLPVSGTGADFVELELED